MKYGCWIFIVTFIASISCSFSDETPHKLTKRQSLGRGQGFPLSRSRQYPPPDEFEEDLSEDDPPAIRPQTYQFRGRQQPPEEYISEDYYTEAPLTTTPAIPQTTATTAAPTTSTTTTKAPNRISAFNRFNGRPRFGSPSSSSTQRSPTSARAVAGPPPKVDVVSEILNKPPPVRPVSIRTASPRIDSRADVNDKKPDPPIVPASRRTGTAIRGNRPRGRFRTRGTTTTTTTTTTAAPEDYYYYYYDDEDESKPLLATTTSTTTTTTTAKPPSLPKRPSLSRRGSSPRPVQRATVKFDPESQFQPPPDDPQQATFATQSSTKRFTTSSTPIPEPGVEGIPYHLRGKYKPRKDGRFIDYYRDPNRPRELKGFDLADYPFYIRVPEDIDFECEDKKDGYYASIPHHCQLFHYCFAGQRYDFLCANYTLYDQTTFTCRFANNVDCPSSEKYYYRNDDLWKVTTTPAPEEKKKRKVVKDEDEEDEEDYSYDDEYYDDEEEERRRRRPIRRRNRRRKNRKNKSSTSTTSTTAAAS